MGWRQIPIRQRLIHEEREMHKVHFVRAHENQASPHVVWIRPRNRHTPIRDRLAYTWIARAEEHGVILSAKRIGKEKRKQG